MRPPSDLPRHAGLNRYGRRTRNVLVALLLLGTLAVVVGRWMARLVTDSWWFDSIGQRDVLSTISLARVELGVVSGMAAACLLYGCLLVVDRTPPLERPHGHDDQLVLRYQVLVAEHGLAVRVIASVAFGVVAALPVASHWQEWLLLRHAVPFGVDDAVYGRDVSFFVFRLPFLSFAVEWVFTVLVVATLLTAVAHYLSGAVHLAGPRRASAGVRLHLAVLCVAMAIVRAVAYWFNRYGLVTSTRGYVRGLGYVDEHHVRPALSLLCLIALTTAALVMIGWRQRSWRLPVASASLWAVTALTANAVYPAVVERMVEHEPPAQREQAGIARNTAATRAAFGLDAARVTTEAARDVAVTTSADVADLADVRLVSPAAAAMTLPTETDSAEFGRAVVDGRDEQVYLAVPSVAPTGSGWSLEHRLDLSVFPPLVVPASSVDPTGTVLPRSNVLKVNPAAGPVLVTASPAAYGILAGSDRGATPTGLASVDLSSFARRAAFALRYGDADLVRRTTNRDQILYVRDVRDRVRTLAPFIAWDADPYPVVTDGRLRWIVDGYTTSDAYPSSERADVTGLPAGSGLRRSFNYVRSSVKAVVDGHSGAVTLYAFDTSDPVLTAWRSAFPSLFRPRAELPAGIDAHIRYPLDLLTVQASMWGRYRSDDLRSDDPVDFTRLSTRWSPAPTAFDGTTPIITAATSTTVKGRSGSGATTTTVPDQEAAASSAVPPTYAVWGDAVVGVVPMVAASQAGAAADLAALVTGTVGVDGVPQLRVVRADAEVPSPAAARQKITQAIRQSVPAVSPNAFGELQAVRVGGGIAWVMPWYRALEARLDGVALLVDGKVHLATTVEAAARDAFRVDPGFTTVEGASATPVTPTVPAGLTVTELLDRAQALESRAREQRALGDATTAFATMEQANAYYRAAVERAAALPAVTTPASPAPAAPSAPAPSTAAPTTTLAPGVTA